MRAIPFLALPAILLTSLAHGQAGPVEPSPQVNLYYYGTVKTYETHDSLPGASIHLIEWPSGQELLHLLANEPGRYELELNKAGKYRVMYEADGRVGKTVEIDLTRVPDSVWAGGLGMSVDIKLFRPSPGVDYAMLKEPLGKAAFDGATGLIAWDLAYTRSRQEKLELLLPKVGEPQEKQ